MPSSEPRVGGRSGEHRPHYADRHVGRAIRQRRAALGMAPEELAVLAGISARLLLDCERGLDHLPAGRLHWIAEALETEVGHFFEGLREVEVVAGHAAFPPRPSPEEARWASAMGSLSRAPLAALDCAAARLRPAAAGMGDRLARLVTGARPLIVALVALNVAAGGLALSAGLAAMRQQGSVAAPLPARPIAASAEVPERLVAREPAAWSTAGG